MSAHAHTCHAIGCTAPCPPRMLMCAACWALVQPETQAEVYAAHAARRAPSDRRWLAAARDAMADVAEARGDADRAEGCRSMAAHHRAAAGRGAMIARARGGR
jgi:hypothetical protein